MMRGRAALYDRDIHTVFLNPHHFKFRDDLERVRQKAGEDGERCQLAERAFREEYQVLAGKLVILAWFFRGRPEWTDADWQKCLSMEQFTVHLADPSLVASALERYQRRRE
jgi:hypothetical protein